MKKSSLILCFVLILGQFHVFAQTDDLRAREIVKKAQNITLGINSSSTMTMQIVRPEWSRTVSMQTWSMGTEYYLIYITAPARDKGQVFLKREKICGIGCQA